jgi:chitinase
MKRINFAMARTAILPLLIAAVAAHGKPKLPVLAFYAEWDQPGSVDYNKVTHILLAFSLPQGGGSVQGYVPGGLVSSAHGAGVKVIASIGGANHGSIFPGIASSAGARSTFANSCKSLIDNNQLDGVDIDWEYPLNASDSANFTLLLKAVRSAIGSKLLTIDVAADGEKGAFIHKSALLIPDFVNVMSYDFTGSFAGSAIGQHAPYSKATSNLNYWRVKGVPMDKLILGVPFYGKDFNAGGNAVPYGQIMSSNPSLSPDADSVGRTWFNGVTTMKKKATYVAQNNYGGIMIWELAQDAGGSKSLLEAVNQGLLAQPLVAIAPRTAAGDKTGYGRLILSLSASGIPGADLGFRDMLGHRREVVSGAAPVSGAYIAVPGGR